MPETSAACGVPACLVRHRESRRRFCRRCRTRCRASWRFRQPASAMLHQLVVAIQKNPPALNGADQQIIGGRIAELTPVFGEDAPGGRDCEIGLPRQANRRFLFWMPFEQPRRHIFRFRLACFQLDDRKPFCVQPALIQKGDGSFVQSGRFIDGQRHDLREHVLRQPGVLLTCPSPRERETSYFHSSNSEPTLRKSAQRCCVDQRRGISGSGGERHVKHRLALRHQSDTPTSRATRRPHLPATATGAERKTSPTQADGSRYRSPGLSQ